MNSEPLINKVYDADSGGGCDVVNVDDIKSALEWYKLNRKGSDFYMNYPEQFKEYVEQLRSETPLHWDDWILNKAFQDITKT
jgi:hypothetical protein